ncbi:MAG: hypothetical protein ABTQ32_12990 [Myxococcaceae bacterium]
MRHLVVVVLLASACVPPAGPLAKVWTPREFFAKRAETKPLFGGWAPSELLVTEGQPIPYSTRTQSTGEGLPVFPGVSEGRAIGFVITDVWQDHPQPWIQPVWMSSSRDAPSARRVGVENVFPVALDSTFYSPWWRMRFVPIDDGEVLTHSKQVLDRGNVIDGAMVMCPFTGRDSIDVAAEAGGVRHPLTSKLLKGAEKAKGFVDGVLHPYLDFGPGRAQWHDQELVAADLFVFTRAGAALPVATIWPADPARNGFLTRVEVPVPAGAAFFVPSNRPDLRMALGTLAPDVDPALDGFPEYALRLARTSACFSTPNFPASCDWLDTQAKVKVLPGQKRTTVQLSAAVLSEVTP